MTLKSMVRRRGFTLVELLVVVAVIALLIAVLLLFSVFLLLRGHDLPGGGFGNEDAYVEGVGRGFKKAFKRLRVGARVAQLQQFVLVGVVALRFGLGRVLGRFRKP